MAAKEQAAQEQRAQMEQQILEYQQHQTQMMQQIQQQQIRMAMERVWTDIAKPDPCPNPLVSLCPAHESIHGHGCQSKSKSVGYPDIHGYPCP
jgi:hypothetical protein